MWMIIAGHCTAFTIGERCSLWEEMAGFVLHDVLVLSWSLGNMLLWSD